jgi:hypothetical protein
MGITPPFCLGFPKNPYSLSPLKSLTSPYPPPTSNYALGPLSLSLYLPPSLPPSLPLSLSLSLSLFLSLSLSLTFSPARKTRSLRITGIYMPALVSNLALGPLSLSLYLPPSLPPSLSLSLSLFLSQQFQTLRFSSVMFL